MAEISDESNSSGNHTSLTVGERLRQAREAKKITIAQAVTQLRLTKETIVYLESDQWDKLHGRPYARGYFSNYVTFLGLPHDEMLALFNMEYTATEPSIDGFKRTEHDKQDGAGLGWLKVVLFFAILAAVIGYAYQYWLATQQSDSERSPSLSEFEPAQSINEQTIGNTIQTQPDDKVEPDVAADIIPPGETVIEPPLVEEVTVLEEVAASAVEEVGLGEDSVSVEEDRPIELQDTPDNLMVTGSDSQEVHVIEEQKLTLQFSDDCWVEITDRNNQKLLHKIARSGETIDISGDWPLHVTLGNASAAVVRYNNNEFDISTFVRKNVAKFSVGEQTE